MSSKCCAEIIFKFSGMSGSSKARVAIVIVTIVSMYSGHINGSSGSWLFILFPLLVGDVSNITHSPILSSRKVYFGQKMSAPFVEGCACGY